MKKSILNDKSLLWRVFLILAIAIPQKISSQVSYGGTPYSFTEAFRTKQAKSGREARYIRVQDLDMSVIEKELETIKSCKNCNSGFFYGKEIDINIDFFEHAGNNSKRDPHPPI